MALGWFMPMVKRLWTASFILYCLGWVLLMMVGIVVLVDYLGFRRVVFPFVVFGMNPLFYYSMGFLLRDAIAN